MSRLSDEDVAAIRVWLDKYVDLCLESDWDKVLDMLTDAGDLQLRQAGRLALNEFAWMNVQVSSA